MLLHASEIKIVIGQLFVWFFFYNKKLFSPPASLSGLCAGCRNASPLTAGARMLQHSLSQVRFAGGRKAPADVAAEALRTGISDSRRVQQRNRVNVKPCVSQHTQFNYH